MSSDQEFITKTHAELADLVRQARHIRRSITHIPCADNGACRHCKALRFVHRRMDDYLAQLLGETTLTDRERASLNIAAKETVRYHGGDIDCGVKNCGRRKRVNPAGVIVCTICDGYPQGGPWTTIRDEDHA